MKNTNPIRYACKCGCTHTSRDMLKRERTDNGRYTACKEHGGLLTHRLRECMDCPTVVEITTHGHGAPRCETCKEIKKKARLKKARNRYYESEKHAASVKKSKVSRWSKDSRGDYCSWMKSCIANHVLRCDGCRKFEGVFFGYDPGKKCA